MEPLAIVNCAMCGKPVEIYHKARLNAKTICCSTKCAGALRRQNGYNCVCAVCGKPMHKKPFELRQAKQPLTCSRECFAKLRATIYLGENNPNYGNKGEKSKLFIGNTSKHCGYLWDYSPDHPLVPHGSCGRVREHRLVAEQFFLTEENSIEIDGERYLNPEYVVHHIDGDKHNNDPSNLMVMTRSEHSKLHMKLRREKGA